MACTAGFTPGKCKATFVLLSIICATYSCILGIFGVPGGDQHTSARGVADATVVLAGFGTIFAAVASFDFNVLSPFSGIAKGYEDSCSG